MISSNILNQTHIVKFDDKQYRALNGVLETVEGMAHDPIWSRLFFHDLMDETGIEPDTDPLTLLLDNTSGVLCFLENTINVINGIVDQFHHYTESPEILVIAELQRLRDNASAKLDGLKGVTESIFCAVNVDDIIGLYDSLIYWSYYIPCLHGQIIGYQINNSES